MGSTERRERERQGLRKKILEAARELFSQYGYEAVTMRKVAEKIEYSPTTIYLHFADKDELVRELCTEDFLALASHFRALEAEPDPVRRVKGFGFALLRFAQERPNHYRMMFMTPHPPVAVAERRIEKSNPDVDAWAFLKCTVAEAQAAGQLRQDLGSPEAVAQILFAAIHGVAALHIAKANDPWIEWRPVEETAAHLIDVLLRGCGHTGPAPIAARAPRKPRQRKSRA
jgi:AcrR family transcriptional regulator